MRRPQRADPAARRAVLLEARARIDRELARLDAAMAPGSPELAQDGLRAADAATVPLKAAADAWGLTGAGAWKRAVRLEPLGLAVKLKPGGWRVRVEALG